MNLAGKDLEPNRDDVFHITFPAEWTIADIQSLFFPFGGVFIYWLVSHIGSDLLTAHFELSLDV